MGKFFITGVLIAALYVHAFANGQRDAAQADAPLSGKVENGVRIVEVKASQYKFEPDPIVVKLDEKVRLVVTAADVSHGLAISDFNINLVVPAKETKEVEFTAKKKGVFRIYCSVYCGPGHAGMRGSLIVRE